MTRSRKIKRNANKKTSRKQSVKRKVKKLQRKVSRKVSRRKRFPRVVVSLTTLPSRINGVARTLRSILNQTLVPDKIYLNLPVRTSKGEKYKIPPNLEKLMKTHSIIKINRPRKDYGPGTKLYPTLTHEKGPNTRIITIDDDSIYPRKTIKYLVETSLKRPDDALAYSAWNINTKKFGIEDYTELGGPYVNDLTWTWGRECSPGYMDIIEGWGGALYIRKFFMDGKKDERKKFIEMMTQGPKACFFVDDVWISAWLAKKGIHIYIVEKDFLPKHTTKDLNVTLHGSSQVLNRNSECAKFYSKIFKNIGFQTEACKERIRIRFNL